MSCKIVVAGAGGFIGGHLVKALLETGEEIVAVDKKSHEEWYQVHPRANNLRLDLSRVESCELVAKRAHTIYNLAADMGGMGFIESHKAECMLSVLINTNLLRAAKWEDVTRYFYASSACVYAADKQTNPNSMDGLREEDAYPAMPEDGYGWEKLFSERMCRHFREDFGTTTRIGRYHNVYGPHGTWHGGREKAPAAICRKVIEATINGVPEIEIWGDGTQLRSFMFIPDCIRGTLMLTQSEYAEPLNIGSSESVTINQLVSLAEHIAGIKLKRIYKLDAPKGVNARNSDNTKIKEVLGWEPTISLLDGLEKTYEWIYNQMKRGTC